VLSQVGGLLLITDRSSVNPSTALWPQLLSGQFLLTAQSSVDFVCREGFRNIVTEPLTDLLVTGVIGVPKCIEKLCKSLWSPTVFGWTTSLSRHANLLKRFVSGQDFFKKKLVLPAVPEIILVQ